MEIQPINVPELVGTMMALLIALIPVMGATVRFAAKPLIDALQQSGALGSRSGSNEVELARLSRRVLELEQELARRKSVEFSLPPERVGARG